MDARAFLDSLADDPAFAGTSRRQTLALLRQRLDEAEPADAPGPYDEVPEEMISEGGGAD